MKIPFTLSRALLIAAYPVAYLAWVDLIRNTWVLHSPLRSTTTSRTYTLNCCFPPSIVFVAIRAHTRWRKR